MVHEKYYEEKPDPHLEQILPAGLRIEKAGAMPLRKPRLIGDIGLRGFFPVFKKAKNLIRNERIDFVYITIPSFYGALWGRWLHRTTGIKYGIDYIDPWVHEFPGSNKAFSRAWWASRVANFLEPIAVKKASLITGVAASYYEGVLERNKHLHQKASCIAIPYGSEKKDHSEVHRMQLSPYLFEKKGRGQLRFVYAGAMLPKAYSILETVFEQINENPSVFKEVEFHFIGTGKTPNDKEGFNIKPYAIEYDLWQQQVFEYPARIPYLDVLVHLNAADAVFILGSTEPHYTPSKVYQAVLSGKPVLAILHEQSTAVEVLRKSGAGYVISFSTGKELADKLAVFPGLFAEFIEFKKQFDPAKINMEDFEQYSAANITGMLAKVLDEIIPG
jgi:glycosyltransferase involved in cell wall biosynthesis